MKTVFLITRKKKQPQTNKQKQKQEAHEPYCIPEQFFKMIN